MDRELEESDSLEWLVSTVMRVISLMALVLSIYRTFTSCNWEGERISV